jgi:hypothetical protein
MNIINENLIKSNKVNCYYLLLNECGNQIYIKYYRGGVAMGKRSGNGRTYYISKEADKNRHDAVVKARRRFMMLVQSNFSNNDKFITLTFRENLSDIHQANYEFKKFIERLKYKYGDFKYIACIEFQKRGAIHYHMICSLDYIKKSELASIWRNGFVKINNIKEVDDLGAYLIKYMVKDKDIWKLARNKSYLYSKGLKINKPLYDCEALEKIRELNLKKDNVVYSGVYDKPDGRGNIDYVFDVQLVKVKNKKYRKENKSCGFLDELLEIDI